MKSSSIKACKTNESELMAAPHQPKKLHMISGTLRYQHITFNDIT